MAHKNNFVRGAVASVAGAVLAFTGLAATAQAAEEPVIPIQPTEGATQLNIIGYNDFHGRLSNLEYFASTALCAVEPFGFENTLFVGNGDQVGASEFESALQQDEPTIAALKELGRLQSFTAGNHEFDAGQEDTERIRQSLGGTLLAANVTRDNEPAFDSSHLFSVNGVNVAVVGAVTDSTPSGVSPAGIEGLTFGDPVAAVNEEVKRLKDSGMADIIIASYHEGGPSGDEATNMSNEEFANMVNNTSDDVDVIFNGHTHQSYAYEIDGRPVVQASQYGEAIGQVVLTIDADGNVSAEAKVVPTYLTDGEGKKIGPNCAPTSDELVAQLDRVMAIKDDAYAQAEELGAEEIGVVNDDITRAYTWEAGAPVKDDRAQASSLGVLVADSMHVWANDNTTGADLSIMNPGGLRADIAGDGVLTYKDAQTVLPFTNSLALVTLTGEQFKTVLEEQWQLDANGEVPSRPYLQLGVSSNVSYTYDDSRERLDKITSVTIDGEPLDLAAEYTLVMPSFLATGGDNFHTLAEGNMVDTGSIDLDAFKSYVQSLPNKELVAPTARPGIETEGYFSAYGEGPAIRAEEDFTFTVKDFNLRSHDFVANETIEVTIDGKTVGTATLGSELTENGEVVNAEVTINVPAEFTGAQTLSLNFVESGAVAELPFTVKAAPSLVVTPESATDADSTAGFTFAGEGWEPGVEVNVAVKGPDGIEKSFTEMPDEDGKFETVITWATFDEDGNVIADNQEFPIGDYNAVATQTLPAAEEGAEPVVLTAEATFSVTGVDAPTEPTEPTDGETIPTDDETTAPTDGEIVPTDDKPGSGELPATGADSNLIVGSLAIAALLAAGGVTLLARRNA